MFIEPENSDTIIGKDKNVFLAFWMMPITYPITFIDCLLFMKMPKLVYLYLLRCDKCNNYVNPGANLVKQI